MLRKTPLRQKATRVGVAPKNSRKVAKRKRQVPTITKLKKQLWEECRRIIKSRYPARCYTCERDGLEGSSYHIGHFIPSSISSVEVRYSLDNLRPQCYSCNIHKSGNWPAYERHLSIEKGVDFPIELKKLNESTKNRQYDILWYQAKLAEYRNL